MEYLKIKDDVDLKELEKYGYTKSWMGADDYFKQFDTRFICVSMRYIWDGKIREPATITSYLGNINEMIFPYQQIDVIQNDIEDIEQAGLVEKVVE